MRGSNDDRGYAGGWVSTAIRNWERGKEGGGGGPRSNLQGLVGLEHEEKWAKEVAAK